MWRNVGKKNWKAYFGHRSKIWLRKKKYFREQSKTGPSFSNYVVVLEY